MHPSFRTIATGLAIALLGAACELEPVEPSTASPWATPTTTSTIETTTTLTNPPAPSTTTPATTDTRTIVWWSDIAVGTPVMPTINIEGPGYPDTAGVQFTINGTVDIRDAVDRPDGRDTTGPRHDSTFNIHPAITLEPGDTIEAHWTGLDGNHHTYSHQSTNGASVTPTTTPPTTLPPTTTTPPTTTSPPTTTTPTPDLVFFEDFVANNSMDRFESGIYHRDDFIGGDSWPGDHIHNGPHDSCTAPEETRTITRGARSNGFNNDWIYRCAPGADTTKAHIMTSIGDASGYSIGSFAPTNAFTDVTEVRWDVNITDLTGRQWTEIKIIPAGNFDFQNMPCTIENLPCGTDFHSELGSVGTSFQNAVMRVHNGDTLHRWNGNGNWDKYFRYPDDPARDSIRIRRQHFFRDNGNNTLTFGIETETGDFEQLTVPGAFPTGDVRVVFADHTYTPGKDGATHFTWHWDNIAIYDQSSTAE